MVIRRVLVMLVLVAGLTFAAAGPGGTVATTAPEACPLLRLPTRTSRLPSYDGWSPALGNSFGDEADSGTSLHSPDLDGDGRPDPASLGTIGSDTVVEYDTSAGIVALVAPGQIPIPFDIGASDFNGDGHDDILIAVGGRGPAFGGIDYAVSGDLRPGVYDIAKVGVRLPASWATQPIRAVGDQNHDGFDDVLVGGSQLYSGADLLRPGPGGVADPTPYRTLDGFVPDIQQAIIPLGADDGPLTMLIVKQFDPSTALITVGLDGPQLTTHGLALLRPLDPAPATFGSNIDVTNVQAFVKPGGPVIILQQPDDPAEGGPERFWEWDLSTPCPGSTTTTTSTTTSTTTTTTTTTTSMTTMTSTIGVTTATPVPTPPGAPPAVAIVRPATFTG